MKIEFNISNIITLIISIYAIVTGVIQLIKGKFQGKQEKYAEYTEDSLKLFARVSGIVEIISGFGLFFLFTIPDQFSSLTFWIGIAALVAFILLAEFVGGKIILKKK